jgi:hypothetical protein
MIPLHTKGIVPLIVDDQIVEQVAIEVEIFTRRVFG